MFSVHNIRTGATPRVKLRLSDVVPLTQTIMLKFVVMWTTEINHFKLFHRSWLKHKKRFDYVYLQQLTSGII